ncbi:MAG TPA: hypothetical protein VGB82_16610 [Alphaproteobacteria bacterium]
MTEISELSRRDAVEASLTKKFAADERWPIGRPALAALVDMGLSNEAIAAYFSVGAPLVASLRQDYGL